MRTPLITAATQTVKTVKLTVCVAAVISGVRAELRRRRHRGQQQLSCRRQRSVSKCGVRTNQTMQTQLMGIAVRWAMSRWAMIT